MSADFNNRIAKILFDGIRYHCDGYVENYLQYPGGAEQGPYEEVVDGRINFPALAEWLIDTLKLNDACQTTDMP